MFHPIKTYNEKKHVFVPMATAAGIITVGLIIRKKYNNALAEAGIAAITDWINDLEADGLHLLLLPTEVIKQSAELQALFPLPLAA